MVCRAAAIGQVQVQKHYIHAVILNTEETPRQGIGGKDFKGDAGFFQHVPDSPAAVIFVHTVFESVIAVVAILLLMLLFVPFLFLLKAHLPLQVVCFQMLIFQRCCQNLCHAFFVILALWLYSLLYF